MKNTRINLLPVLVLMLVAVLCFGAGVSVFGQQIQGQVEPPAFFDQQNDEFIADSVTIKPASQYVVEQTFYQGKLIDRIVVPGRPPKYYRAEAVAVPKSNPAAGVVVLSNVPAFDWSYGCSATSAAMMMGYYDNAGYANMSAGPTNGGLCPQTNATWGYGECPLSATHIGYDGRGIFGHVDDYWNDINGNDPYIGNWTEHIWADCTADFMGTNQSKFGNGDGSTTFFNYTDGSPLYDYTGGEPAAKDGCHGMGEFARSRGYSVPVNYSQYIYGYKGNTKGFTFEQFMNEIDNGRPVMIQVSGHSMLGYGYNAASKTVYLRDTWDHYSHSMTWAESYSGMQHYGVTVLQMGSLGQPLVINPPYTFQWSLNTAVSDVLTASGGVAPYKEWKVVPTPSGYFYEILDSSLFSLRGAGEGWQEDDYSFQYTLPFMFKFYGQSYDSVYVCTNGYLDFVSSSADWGNSDSVLESNVRIAPLWDDLVTSGGDIYVDESVAGQVTIRWEAATWSAGSPANFSAVLFKDGRIRFDYGDGNTDLSPTVGISGGNADSSVIVSEYDNTGSLSNAASVMISPFSDKLPGGVTLNSSTGALSGTPGVSGEYRVTIQVKDSSTVPQTAQHAFAIKVNGGYTISGTASLQDFGGSVRGIPVSIELLNANKQTVAVTDSTLDSSGDFQITGVSAGTYYMAVKPYHWLRRVSGKINVGSGNVALGSMSFYNGDCDGDNEVTSTDLSIVLSAMDSVVGDPNWDRLADLDGDQEITSTDLSIMLGNLDMMGD